MIDIQVEGKSIVLYKDTSFQMELNNSIFYTDNIEGDVVYNFDIPVAGNERVFGLNHLPYSASRETYDCIVIVDGVQLIHGSMIVQKSTRLSYSVAISVNPFPEGWAEDSVRNNYDEEIVISNDYLGHRYSWIDYLKSTWDNEGLVKFGIVNCNDGYGSDNDKFGHNNSGSEIGNLVNRLHYVVENGTETIASEEYLLNTYCNSFCFCPQLRLCDMLRKILISSGYSPIGEFFTEINARKIYLHSQRALDGTFFQYPSAVEQRGEIIYINASPASNFDGILQVSEFGYHPSVYDESIISRLSIDLHSNYIYDNEMTPYNNRGVYFQNSGYYKVDVSIKKPLTDIGFWFDFIISKNDSTNISEYEAGFSIIWGFDVGPDPEILNESCYLYVSAGTTLYFKAAQVVNRKVGSGYYSMAMGFNVVMREAFVEEREYVNIFRKSFVPMEFLPQLNNNDFINTIKNTLGLTFMLDSQSKTCEVGFVSSIDRSLSFDLSDYVVEKENYIEHGEYEGYSISFNNSSSDDSIVENTIEPVNNITELPDPYVNIGKYCLVKNINSYYVSKFVSTGPDDQVVATWEYYKSLSSSMEIGDGDNKITKVANIPGLEDSGIYNDNDSFNLFVPGITGVIESDLFDTASNDNIILLFYRGKKTYRLGETYCKIEDMSPVSGDGSFQLNTVGENSLGELHLRKWLEILSKSDTITYKLLLPIGKMIELFNLLRPQDASPDNQTRFIMINSVKLIPKKITAEINNSSGRYLCEVQCVKAN